MAEGRLRGCLAKCHVSRCGWVAMPKPYVEVHRDAWMDAVGITDNPCDRPARCPEGCEPIPKFRRPQRKPGCNICCYQQERAQDKWQDYEEAKRKYIEQNCPQCPPPDTIIENLDPYNTCIEVELECPLPPRKARKQYCKTDIISGRFNPNDNKTPEEMERELCDPYYQDCSAVSRKQCGNDQGQAWQNQDQDPCTSSLCEGSKYREPEHMQRMEQIKANIEERRRQKHELYREEMLKRMGYTPPNPCCPQLPMSLTPFCLCQGGICETDCP